MKEKLSQLEKELEGLDEETKKQKVNEFLGTLSKEELSQIQGNQCIFCAISKNQIPSKKVYEDEKFLAVLDLRPANPGHVILFPKQHKPYLSELSEDELNKMINIANELGKNMVKSIKAEGVNIFVASGYAAGQKVDHIIMHIIPRFKEDGVNFSWPLKEIDDSDLERIKGIIKIEPKPKKVEKKIIPEEDTEIERIP